MPSSFADPDFQKTLCAFICRDREFLKECSYLLEPEDFKPRKHEGNERWIIATIALDFYRKYRDKIGTLLRSEILDFAKKNNYADSQRKDLLAYVKDLQDMTLVGVDHITEKVISYKQERMKLAAIEELIELQSANELTTDRWLEICRKATESFNGKGYSSSNYYKNDALNRRQARREKGQIRKYPLLFIDPLDEAVRIVSRGHTGLVMAPYKRGKSMFLIHIALAYTLQGLNCLFFTLEDTLDDVEDRMDAMITNLPLKRLHDLPVKVRNRFQQYKRLVRGRVRIIDGTEGGMTISKILDVCERERNTGFIPDAVFIDYDDEITPSQQRKERRQEFGDIYREFGRMVRKNQYIGWIAAQTVRKTENRKVISGDTIAEDISKLRKVTCAIGIGQGDWGDNSLYLYIAAHKNDRKHIGWNIISDPSRMCFYDRDATMAMMKSELAAAKADRGEN